MINANSWKMKLFVVGCVFVAYHVHVLFASHKGCSLNVANGSFEKKSPILIRNESSLIIPHHGIVSLKSREIITLICPDPKNQLSGVETQAATAQCVQGKILRVANHDYNFQDLQCKKTIRGTVTKTTKKCGKNKGNILKIGYQISPRIFVSLIDVCYEALSGTVFYSEHLVYGQSIKHASRSNYRPSFSPEGLGSTISASVAYKQTFQKATFSKLLKSASLSEKYINEKSYLARGHLSPDADFLYAAWQYTTYFFINTSPQWQVINSGNWKSIELMVRKLADKLQDTFIITTGTHGVLELDDRDGVKKEIFLVAARKLPVAKYFWKIVYSESSRKAVVLVVLNNPFVDDGIGGSDFLCENVCDQVRWGSSAWANYEHGFVHCCDYREFVNVVETAPQLNVSGLLRGLK